MTRFDPVAAVAGLLAIVGGALFLVDDLSSSVDLRLAVLWPVSVLLIAVVGAATAILRWRRQPQ
jgi:hypothetical protein